MDTNAILSRYNPRSGGRGSLVLEKSRFGKTGLPVLWIDSRNLTAIAGQLREDSDLGVNWLENLSIAQLGEALVASYLVRSTRTPALLMLRCTVELGAEGEKARLPSVRGIWQMAGPMEDQEAELFGIHFVSSEGEPIEKPAGLLPPGVTGFPMRKSPKGGG